MFFLYCYYGYFQEYFKLLIYLFLDDLYGFICCFLFGEGVDEIYLISNVRGLLGIFGIFLVKVFFEG